MKIKKQKKRKSFRYSVNRKRVKKQQTSTGNLKCDDVKEFWEYKKGIRRNAADMGISLDPNTTIPVPSTKQNRLILARITNGFLEEDVPLKTLPSAKGLNVIKKLEEEANSLRKSQLRLPKGLVKNLSYFLDKYKLDYKAMVMDRKNYVQWTWKQFRSKIRKFMSIEEQFREYLCSRNLSSESFEGFEYETDNE